MVFISEWLPNPVGADAAGEFIELYNGGAAPVSLKGWTVRTEKGKEFTLAGGTIEPRAYIVLKRDATKLTLRNTDGGLLLYAPGSGLADQGSFSGNAPEGKSFSRANFGTGPAAHFAWALPTPGAPNATPVIFIATSAYPYGVPLNPQFTFSGFFAIMMGTAALLAALVYYVVTHHEDLSQLLFRGNQSIREEAREESRRENREGIGAGWG